MAARARSRESAPVARSSWSHPAKGVTEEVAFLGPDGGKILAFLHRPTAGAARAGVLLCGSLYEDLTVNYRNEVLVARELARRGFAAARFQYRGAGNSDSLPSGAVSFDSMVEDADRAAAWLVERTGAPQVVIGGSRIGALVAHHLAAPHPDRPLLLWAPMLAGADYFRGMSRASLVAGVRAVARKRQASASAESRLRVEESVEMLGYRVHRTTYDDLGPRALPLTTDAGRPVLLVQLGLGESLSAPYEKLVSDWRGAGARVEVLKVHARQRWYVPDEFEPEDAKPEAGMFAVGIAGWVEDVVGADS